MAQMIFLNEKRRKLFYSREWSGFGANKMASRLGDRFSCTALGTIELLVAWDVDLDQGASGNSEFKPPAAAVNQGGCGDYASACLFDNAHRLAGGTAGRPYIFNDENFFRWLQSKPTAQGHAS
ncbi:MAG TPA: hypothetical protein VGR81_01465 [Candidatus Acidoferrales bacterium]|nr:hypothetical protein [Candidatus Acidoferrales bacterium]